MGTIQYHFFCLNIIAIKYIDASTDIELKNQLAYTFFGANHFSTFSDIHVYSSSKPTAAKS